MKSVILVTAIVCLASAAQAFSQNSQERDTESKLIALERLMRVQALSSKDVNVLTTFLADEFVMVTMEGLPKEKAEFLDYLQSLDSVRYETQEMIVRVHGNTAIVTGLFQMTTVKRGKPLAQRGRFVNTWLNREGRWLIVASVSIPAS
jgi:ketosteroid isomerase-like protein